MRLYIGFYALHHPHYFGEKEPRRGCSLPAKPRRLGGAYVIIGDAEKVVTVENTADGAKVFEDFHGESWVAHTNHGLDLDVSTLKEKAVSKTVERVEGK